MSTFSGLVLGIVTAVIVLVVYGDELDGRLRDLGSVNLPAVAKLLPSSGMPLETGKAEEVGKESSEVAASGLHAVELVAAAGSGGQQKPSQLVPVSRVQSPAKSSAEPGVVDSAPTLQQRWVQYAAVAPTLKVSVEVPHHACFTRAAAAHGIPETLLIAVARGESNFDSAARSNKDAIGLMQIQWPGTSRHLGIRREADLYDPCTNIDAGARYFVELGKRYGGDLHHMLGAYNYGPGRIAVGSMPAGAMWYSQYIYQHLQHVLGRPHVASSALLSGSAVKEGGHHVLMTFSRDYRAREFLQFLRGQAPGIDLAQRSERLGLHEVVLLYETSQDRKLGLQMLQGTGLVALDTRSNTDKSH